MALIKTKRNRITTTEIRTGGVFTAERLSVTTTRLSFADLLQNGHCILGLGRETIPRTHARLYA